MEIGDTSVTKKILMTKPYGPDCVVQKIEWKNFELILSIALLILFSDDSKALDCMSVNIINIIYYMKY